MHNLILDVVSSVSSELTSSSISSAADNTTPTNAGEWFAALWQSIVSFLTTGKLDTNTTSASLLGRIIIAACFFAFFFYVNKFIIFLMRRNLKKSKNRDQAAKTARSFTISVIKALLMIILVTIVMAILGFDLSGLSTIISSAIVAIGLSLQNLISNFASGIIILTSKNFIVGDYISVNSGQAEGTVKDITILSTKLVTPDNIVVFVPNSVITAGVVKNFNIMENRLINLTVSVSYDSDIDSVKKVIRYVIDNQKDVIKDMPITVAITSFEDSSINFCARCYVPSPLYWDTRFALSENIYKEMIKRNIDIPYNQVDVHIKDEKSQPKPTPDFSDLDNVKLAQAPVLKPTTAERADEEQEFINGIIFKKSKTKKKKTPAKEEKKDK
ncbi:MAG: mechanosensitive ion channel family protein [Bacilli bacterium]|jgi:small conductance mechanosensitive channel|nr:mechanosensitive ion channel family protein [Bacilli bacterium]